MYNMFECAPNKDTSLHRHKQKASIKRSVSLKCGCPHVRHETWLNADELSAQRQVKSCDDKTRHSLRLPADCGVNRKGDTRL